MPLTAARPWLIAVLFGLMALSPAQAGMTPGEVTTFLTYKAMAEKGSVVGQVFLGTCYARGEGVAKDFVQAVFWHRKSAEQGNAFAQFYLGNYYDNGEGVAKDSVQAVFWYRKSAEQGNAHGQLNLGYCYAKGQGLAKDEIEAYAYWNLAGITLEDARINLAILEKKMSSDARLLGQQRTKQLQKEIEARLETLEDLRKAAEKESLRKGA
jgi:TPR repeat protein